MFDLPAIVDVLNKLWLAPSVVEAFLQLSPGEQAYLQAIGTVLAGATIAWLRQLLKRFRNRKSSFN